MLFIWCVLINIFQIGVPGFLEQMVKACKGYNEYKESLPTWWIICLPFYPCTIFWLEFDYRTAETLLHMEIYYESDDVFIIFYTLGQFLFTNCKHVPLQMDIMVITGLSSDVFRVGIHICDVFVNLLFGHEIPDKLL